MRALICINLHSSCCLFSTFLQHFLLVRVIGAASHSNFFLCHWMKIHTSQTVVRTTKWKALYVGRNWLILENLDERVELLRHLKVIVPIGINLVESGRTKENQTIKYLQRVSHNF